MQSVAAVRSRAPRGNEGKRQKASWKLAATASRLLFPRAAGVPRRPAGRRTNPTRFGAIIVFAEAFHPRDARQLFGAIVIRAVAGYPGWARRAFLAAVVIWTRWAGLKKETARLQTLCTPAETQTEDQQPRQAARPNKKKHFLRESIFRRGSAVHFSSPSLREAAAISPVGDAHCGIIDGSAHPV